VTAEPLPTTPNPSDPSDPVPAILAANRGAEPALLARKYATMRQTPLSFMRGTCQLFYDTLPRVAELDAAPRTWLSGDLHAENFGAYKGDNRLTYFDVTDFDESALGPPTLDAVRLLASILVAAAEWGLGAGEGDALAARAAVVYATELASGKAAWIERESARGALKRLLAQVAGRSRADLLARFTTRKGRRRHFQLDDRHLFQATDAERAAVEQMLAAAGAAANDPDYFRLVDVARRVVGVGSVGRPRFITLVEGRGSPDRNALLELKAARPSVVVPRTATRQPRWPDEAARIVGVQRHAVAIAPAFLSAVTGGETGFVLRELQLSDDRLTLRDWERQPKKLAEALVTLAAVAAWMHLRAGAWRESASVDVLAAFAAEHAWRDALLEMARDAAARTRAQYAAYCAAYDRGDVVADAQASPDAGR
jgi:uncharacterized protein (DUF2252 family)